MEIAVTGSEFTHLPPGGTDFMPNSDRLFASSDSNCMGTLECHPPALVRELSYNGPRLMNTYGYQFQDYQ